MGELVTYPEALCGTCANRFHRDAIGPDGRCCRCWERDLAPSETGPVLQALVARAGRSLASVFDGSSWAAVYPGAFPWLSASRSCRVSVRVLGQEVTLHGGGPRVLLRRVNRYLRAHAGGAS